MIGKRDILLIPATALGVMIANVALSFAMVWFYSAFIDPGRTQAYYEAFAMRAAPVGSVVAGIPLMLLAGYWLAKGRSRRGALRAAGAAALVYIVLDMAIVLGVAASVTPWGWAVLATSHITKFISALGGAALRARS